MIAPMAKKYVRFFIISHYSTDLHNYMEKLQESEKNKKKRKHGGYRRASSVSGDLSAPAKQHNGIKMVGAVVPLTGPVGSTADLFDDGKAETMAKSV